MRLGIDRFWDSPVKAGAACALICAGSAVDSRGRPVFRLVHERLGPRLKCIWSLQHGFFNDKQDNMILSDSFVHPELGIPVYSLYGQSLAPHPDWLQGLDTLIVDIQDVGTRVYTFTNHLVELARCLSGQSIRWIVLDRPNPLGGIDLEGPLLQSDHRSIVGELAVPMRHALSSAEYLKLAISEENLAIDLAVVPVADWQRGRHGNGIWTLPSPNMPTPATAHIYPGAVLLEGCNLSEGRGTTRPFELVGAPFLDGAALARHMNSLPDTGIIAIPMHFKPEFSKFGHEICSGILCHQADPEKTRSFAFFYELLRWVYHRYPDSFAWKKPPYEFEYRRPPIDMICGGPSLRLAIENDLPLPHWLTESEAEYPEYRERTAGILLY